MRATLAFNRLTLETIRMLNVFQIKNKDLRTMRNDVIVVSVFLGGSSLIFLFCSNIRSKSYEKIWHNSITLALTMYGFRDSVPVLQMRGCYKDTERFHASFHFYLSETRRLQCVDANKAQLLKVFRLYTLIQIVWYINYSVPEK